MRKSCFYDNIIHFDSLDSTNDYAADLIRTTSDRVIEGTCIWTTDQKFGKGQEGNRWESETGKNLTFSLILFPEFLMVEEQFLLSKAVALALADFLAALISNVSIKWPNDIYVDERKIAGILFQNSIRNEKLSYAIAGIGLNVNQTLFRSDAPNPVSMKMITGIDYDLAYCMKRLISFLERRYVQLQCGNREIIHQNYLNALYGFQEYHVYMHAGKSFSAKIIGITPRGQLKLETSDREIRVFNTKEVSCPMLLSHEK